jgi:hypothetical protein
MVEGVERLGRSQPDKAPLALPSINRLIPKAAIALHKGYSSAMTGNTRQLFLGYHADFITLSLSNHLGQ